MQESHEVFEEHGKGLHTQEGLNRTCIDASWDFFTLGKAFGEAGLLKTDYPEKIEDDNRLFFLVRLLKTYKKKIVEKVGDLKATPLVIVNQCIGSGDLEKAISMVFHPDEIHVVYSNEADDQLRTSFESNHRLLLPEWIHRRMQITGDLWDSDDHRTILNAFPNRPKIIFRLGNSWGFGDANKEIDDIEAALGPLDHLISDSRRWSQVIESHLRYIRSEYDLRTVSRRKVQEASRPSGNPIGKTIGHLRSALSQHLMWLRDPYEDRLYPGSRGGLVTTKVVAILDKANHKLDPNAIQDLAASVDLSHDISEAASILTAEGAAREQCGSIVLGYTLDTRKLSQEARIALNETLPFDLEDDPFIKSCLKMEARGLKPLEEMLGNAMELKATSSNFNAPKNSGYDPKTPVVTWLHGKSRNTR